MECNTLTRSQSSLNLKRSTIKIAKNLIKFGGKMKFRKALNGIMATVLAIALMFSSNTQLLVKINAAEKPLSMSQLNVVLPAVLSPDEHWIPDPTVEINFGIKVSIKQGSGIVEIAKDKDRFKGETSLAYDIRPGKEAKFTVYAKFANGTVSSMLDLKHILGSKFPVYNRQPIANGEWTNRDVLLHLDGAKTPYLIAGYEVTDDYDSRIRNCDALGSIFVRTEGYHNIKARARGNNDVYSDYIDRKIRIDKTKPVITESSKVDYTKGEATITITAQDSFSGLKYLETPDGKKIYPDTYMQQVLGNTGYVLSHDFVTTENGYYTFTVMDMAGNEVVKTFDMMNTISDYGIQDLRVHGTGFVYGRPLPISAKIKNISGDENITVKIQSKGTTSDPNKLTDVYAGKLVVFRGSTSEFKWELRGIPEGAKTVIVTVNPSNVPFEKNREDNIAKVDITAPLQKFEIKMDHLNVDDAKVIWNPQNPLVTLQDKIPYLRPYQNVNTECLITTDLTEESEVTLAYFIKPKDKTEYKAATQTIKVGGSQKNLVVFQNLIAPKHADTNSFEVIVRVAFDTIGNETNRNNNEMKASIKSADVNLDLVVNGIDAVNNSVIGDITDKDVCDFVFRAKDKYSTIKDLVIGGKVYETGNKNEVPVKIANLKQNETQDVSVVVLGGDGMSQETYYFKITKYNDNVDVKVTYTTESGTRSVEMDNKDWEKIIKVGTNTKVVQVVIETKSGATKIINVNKEKTDTVKYSTSLDIATSGTATLQKGTTKVEFTSKSGTGKEQDFSIVFSTENDVPTVKHLTAVDYPAGIVFAETGVLKTGKFYKYGENGVTSVPEAVVAGATHGLVYKFEASDKNLGQMLSGNVMLNGIKYPIRWGGFKGEASIKSGDTVFGYVYVPINSIAVLGNTEITPTVAVTDGDLTSTELTLPKVMIKVTGPTIVITVKEELPTGIPFVVTTPGNASEIKDIKYAISKDGGRKWIAETATLIGKENVVKEHGNILLRATVTDIWGNVTTETLPLVFAISADDTLSDTSIYHSKTRIADYYYIGTNKDESTSITGDKFDFK